MANIITDNEKIYIDIENVTRQDIIMARNRHQQDKEAFQRELVNEDPALRALALVKVQRQEQRLASLNSAKMQLLIDTVIDQKKK